MLLGPGNEKTADKHKRNINKETNPKTSMHYWDCWNRQHIPWSVTVNQKVCFGKESLSTWSGQSRENPTVTVEDLG